MYKELLKDYSEGKDITWLSRKYHFDWQKVKDILIFEKVYEKKIFLNNRKDIKEFILKNKDSLSISDMARILNVSNVTVTSVMKKLKIPIKGSGFFKKTPINENYFEIIDTKDKAYFLGFMFADGNIHITKCGRKRIQISLDDIDSYILELFKIKLEYQGNLYKEKTSTRFLIHNEKLFDDLNNLGCVVRKSLILKYPKNIPHEFESHFIRGYFDGDGSISIRKKSKNNNYDGVVSFTGSLFMMGSISNIFILMGFKVSNFFPRYKDKIDSAGSINIYLSKTRNIEIFRYLYNNCEDLYLKRKKEKFELILNS